MADEERGKVGIVLLLVLGMFVIAASLYGVQIEERHSAFDDLKSFFDVIEYASYGDMEGAFSALDDALTFLAMFALILVTIYFVFSTSLSHIFKTKRMALILALVITIYCFINDTIYNYFLALSAYSIAFLVFLVVVLLLWRTSQHMKL